MSAPPYAGMTFAILSAWVLAQLPNWIDQHVVDPATVTVDPGPPTYEGVADSATPQIVLTIGGGPGLEQEDLFDRLSVSADVAGDQGDPISAEHLALGLDRLFLSISTPTRIGGVLVKAVRRTGGRPTPIGVDNGDRWHLACPYIFRVESGIDL